MISEPVACHTVIIVLGLIINNFSGTTGVPVQPVVSLNKDPVVGTNVLLICRSSSTSQSPFTYSWKRNGSVVRGQTGQGLSLTITKIDRGIQYTCAVTDSGGMTSQESQPFVIFPQFSPVVHIEPRASPYRVVKGAVLDLFCNVTEANPAVTSYMWSFGTANRGKSPRHIKSPVSKSDSGLYRCTVSNGNHLHNTTVTTTVDVLYLGKPILTSASAEVNEKQPITLSCNVDSNPSSVMSWRRADSRTLLRQEIRNFGSYVIAKAECLDAGIFQCETTNTAANLTEMATIDVRVRCSPRLDFRTTTDDNVYALIGEKVSMTVRVIAYPAPTFTWYHVTSEFPPPLDVKNPRLIVTSDDATSTLTITNLLEKDFGTYFVKVSNSEGSATLSVKLTSGGKKTTETLGMWASIGVGVAAGICLSFIVIVTVCILRRTICKTQKVPDVSTEEEAENRYDIIPAAMTESRASPEYSDPYQDLPPGVSSEETRVDGQDENQSTNQYERLQPIEKPPPKEYEKLRIYDTPL